MDVDPEAAKFGSPGRYLTASVLDADRHFQPKYF